MSDFKGLSLHVVTYAHGQCLQLKTVESYGKQEQRRAVLQLYLFIVSSAMLATKKFLSCGHEQREQSIAYLLLGYSLSIKSG